MASNKLEVSDFDFDNIKSNLKTFLQSQTEFSDYNFEGSGFAVLLDILAYNTHYLGFNANMLANEMYLDSADIRKNIVSLAKMLNYTPSSVRAPVTNLNITVNDATGSSLTLTKGTAFITSVLGTTYQYLTNEDYTISPVNGVYNFSSVNVYEGTLVTYRYIVDKNDVDQKFIINSLNADTTTLKVSVQNSSTDTITNIYSLAGGYNGVSNTSNVYFLQEGEDGKFEVYFGDGVVGTSLSDGNIIILEYIVTNKDQSNGASSFTLSTTIGGFSDVSIITNSASQGGTEAESKESIRFNAPLNYSAQNRAVTTTDYETIVKSIYPNALSVSAWGGENDETPVYGVVKIAIKAKSGSTLTNSTKSNIVTSLKPYNVASVRPVIVDPQVTSVLITSNVKYDSRLTTKTADTLKSDVINQLTNYNTNTLQKFDGIFRYSKVVGLIDNTDTSIVSNITTIKIRKNFTPTLNSSTKYDIYFRNSLYNPVSGYNSSQGGILESTGFKINGDTTNIYYLNDDGSGNVRSYKLVNGVKTYVNNSQGIINYSTGQITLSSLNISNVENIRNQTSTAIELTVKTNSNDIVPVRDQIIEIDIENSYITVQPDTFVGGSADAGVGYTTTTSY
jgi:hypothetical protein